MPEAQAQPVRVEARPVGKVEQARATVKKLSQEGKKWFKDKWEKVTGKKPSEVRQVLKDVEKADENVLLADEIEKPDQKIKGIPKEQVFSQPITSVIESYGGVTGVSGEGRDKIAYNVGSDKVAVIHKENVAPKENSAEFYKSQYYLHQILHTLMPDNFPEVRMASGENIVIVDRVPDTEDFIKAKDIRKRMIGEWTKEEKEWVNSKMEETKNLENFKKVTDVLSDILLLPSYGSRDELAIPSNSVIINGKPIIVELLNPHTNVSPAIDEEAFNNHIAEKVKNGSITPSQENHLRNFYTRYKINVNECLNEKKMSKKKTTKPVQKPIQDTVVEPTTIKANEQTELKPKAKSQFDFEVGIFEKETQPSNEPVFNWKEILKEALTENGVKNINTDLEKWGDLENSMREHIVMQNYLKPLIQFMSKEAPDIWTYVEKYYEGFRPEKSNVLGLVREGAGLIGLNVDALISAVADNDRDKMSMMVATVYHEAKHIELNEYSLGITPLPEGKDEVFTKREPEGYMAREKECWEFQTELYRRLTKNEPPLIWKDVYEDYYKRYY